MTTRQRKTSYEVEQYHTVSSKLVHLDGDNPRHTALEREPEIIAKLCDEQLVALATDIAERGAMSPLEVMGVIEHEGLPGHFIAVEGNRRTCALILLADPSRAPSTELRATFKRIAQNAKIPNKLHVYLFENRAKGEPWIALRHLGAQGGIGTREWDPNAKARASTRSTSNTTAKADILALRILERLLEIGLITEEQQTKIPLTTLSRYLNNKTRRAIFGLSDLNDENELVYTHDFGEVDSALQRFVLDSLPGDDDTPARVHSRASAKDRDAYARDFASQGFAPTTPLDDATPPPASKRKSIAEPSTTTSSRSRSTPNPVHRNKFIGSSFTVKSDDKVLLRLRTEMQTQPIEHHEFAANYLLRAFIERVLFLYFRHNNPNRQHKNEADLCQQCATDARAKGAPRNVQQILGQADTDKHIAHSLNTLGTAVHGTTFPVRKQLLAAFDTWEPALRYMLDAVQS